MLVFAVLAGAAPAQAIDWPLRKVFSPKVGGASVPKTPAGESGPVVFGVQAGAVGDISRLEITATGPMQPRLFLLDDPMRAIIDLPDTVFRIDPAVAHDTRSRSKGGGLIKSYRYGLFGPDRSRVVIDLAGPAKLARFTAIRITDSVHRLRIDLAGATKAEFRKAANEGLRNAAAGAAGAPAASKPAGDEALPLVVIDPGHGGVDGGAQSASGLSEKDVVFAFATELARQLRKTGRYRVILTRESDVFVPLQQRVAIAQEAGARLLISVHADSIGQSNVQGATVYTVSDRASDADAARLAEKENSADERAGFVAPQAKAEVSDILFDLTRRETRAFSHVFANSLVSYLRKTARMNSNPHRSGSFVVLKAIDVPSVLLELGFLSNSADAARLGDAKWREQTAANATAAVDGFFNVRSTRDESGTGASAKIATTKAVTE